MSRNARAARAPRMGPQRLATLRAIIIVTMVPRNLRSFTRGAVALLLFVSPFACAKKELERHEIPGLQPSATRKARPVAVAVTFTGATFPNEKSTPGCTASAADGVLRIACVNPADFHLLSEPIELTADREYRITGKVKGAVLASPQSKHPGGVGLLGEKPLVDFPGGSYDWRPFNATFTVSSTGSRRVTVGLGGWKQGQGEIEVKDFRLER